MLPEPGEEDALELDATQIIEDEEEGEPFVGFVDDDEETPEETSLVKRLRDQLRSTTKQLNQTRRSVQDDDDPEPQVLPRPNLERDFNFDQDKFDEADEAYQASREARIKWEAREERRKSDRENAAKEQTKAIEQQKRALGVSDFDERAAHVHDRLTPQQISIILDGAEKPAALIYALGRSPSKLDMIAGEANLTKFAFAVSKLEKDLKMGRRQPPAPEQQVRGGNASLTSSADKVLEKLEKEADKTGDRTKVIDYKRKLRAAA